MKHDYQETQWRKAYDKAWLSIFDSLPMSERQLIKASPSGKASMEIGWKAAKQADKETLN